MTTQYEFGPTSGQMQELAQLLSATDEWQHVRQVMVDAYERTGDQNAVIDAARAALTDTDFGGRAVVAAIPEPYRSAMSQSDIDKAIQGIDGYMIASIATEVLSGQPLPVMPLAGNDVRVEWVEQEGLRFPIIHAFVTPLGDPVATAERFLDLCFRTFDAETFAKRTAGARDAEWWTRHNRGDGYRDIALSDERSGLALEARADPNEYADEIVRATDTVRRAVKRFNKRWTQKVESLSKEEG